MPRVKLTATTIKALKSPATGRVDYWDRDLPGFGLRITDRGQRTWMVMYRADGVQRRYKIESYPNLGLAEARQRAKDVLYQVAHGKDPAAEKKAGRKAETIKELADDYIEHHAKPKKRSWKTDRRILDRDVIPSWGNRKVASIRRGDIIALTKAILGRGAPIMANRTYEVIRKMFGYAVQEEIIGMTPCVQIAKPANENPRERTLTEDELRAVWRAIEAEPPQERAILKLRLFTLQRGSEVRSMRWTDFDPLIDESTVTAWWTIPGEFAKNGRAHRVFLPEAAVTVLREMKRLSGGARWVFPGKGTDGPRVDRWDAADRVRRTSGVDFKPHDLRRSGASFMTGSLGVPRLTVSKILNHSDSSVTRVYDRHSYNPEKQMALAAWAQRLEEIVRGKCTTSNVVELKRA
jgi:integrase